MNPALRLLLPALLAGLAPTAALAAGAWTTYLRAYEYRDLLPTSSEVWCATGEAGLLRFDRASGTFSAISREPGGLASNHLNALAYDRSGRLWAGTADAGVSRLSADGVTWGLVNDFDGLPSLDVTVLETFGDTLWIGTLGGLALWNGHEIAGALPDGANPSPFASNEVTGIVQDGDSLWVSTAAGIYLGRISNNLTSWTAVNSGLLSTHVDAMASDGATIFALSGTQPFVLVTGGQWNLAGGIGTVYRLQDDAGTVLASSNSGIYRWISGGWSLVSGTLTSGGSARTQYAAAVDDAGLAFAANRDGLVDIAGATRTFPPFTPGNNLLNVAIDGPRIYVSTLDEGIGRLTGSTWKYWFPAPTACTSTCDTTFIESLFSFALLVDARGRKWFGCWGFSFDELDDSGPVDSVFHHFNVADPADTLRRDSHTWAWASAVDSSGGRPSGHGQWFGMDTPLLGDPTAAPIGLEHYDSLGVYRANFRSENSGVTGNKIHGLTVDKGGVIWVGTAGQGLLYFTPQAQGVTPTFNQVNQTAGLDVEALVAVGDTIWALTTSDVRWYGRLSHNFGKAYGLPAGPALLALNPLAVGPDRLVWVGTVNGIRVYRPDGTTYADFTASNSPLAGDEVRAIRIEKSGVVWIATSEGLNRYDPHYVPPSPPRLPSLDVRVYPNPILMSNLGVSLSLQGNGIVYRGSVHDLNGRLVRRFESATNGRAFWDGRDLSGKLARPGLYFVRVEAGGRSAVLRVTLLR